MLESHYIRVGFYDEFKGYDSVLISVDIHGLLEIENIFLKLSNGLSAFPFSDLKFLDKNYRINITAYNDVANIGMKQIEKGNFEWRLTKEKWRQFREILTALLHNSNCAHQYLDAETGDIDLDSLQVVLSLNEYPLTFWQQQFYKCNG